jgi:hypothetical protein
MNVIAAPAYIVAEMPSELRASGTRKVPMAAPKRVRATAMPTAAARICVGNSSFG